MSQAVTVVLYCLTLRKSVLRAWEHTACHSTMPCDQMCISELTCDTDYRTLQCLASLLASGPRAVMSCPTGNHVKPASLSALQGVALPGCPAWRKKKPDLQSNIHNTRLLECLLQPKCAKENQLGKGTCINCINNRLSECSDCL